MMMNAVVHGGGCLCRAVRYEVRGKMRDVVFCHCTICRVHGPLATVGIGRRQFTIVAGETLTSYRSSAKALRWFCGVCGAATHWDPIGREFVAVFAGTLDQPTNLRASAHIYVAEKPDFYEIRDGVQQYAGPLHPEDDDPTVPAIPCPELLHG